MAARMRIRGRDAYYDPDAEQWRWADTDRPATDERPCPSCGLTAEPGGPDPCIGMVPGVTAACCGHGHDEDRYRVVTGHVRPCEAATLWPEGTAFAVDPDDPARGSTP